MPDAEDMPGEPGAAWCSWAEPGEVDTFDEFVRRFWKGELSPEEFKQFRLQNGVYGQSQEGAHMMRVKVPAGGLTAAQLDMLAELAGRTPRGIGHVTTRQNLQFHFVKLEEVAELLEKINASGLTTREACANTVRTLTACHRSGVCAGEAFDVSPYAVAASRFFLRNPMNQSLPRKMKMSFSGCREDCALPSIHDIGAVAALKDGARGFEVYIGGGLGAQPRQARLLEPFTPAEDLIPALAAIVRVFDRHGNREQRSLARLKFCVEKLGFEEFRRLVLKDRERLRPALAGQFPALEGWTESAPERDCPALAPDGPADPEYGRWLASNVLLQKQPGYALVHVRLTLGDITAAQLQAVAEIARRRSNGTIRTSIQQNLAIRWVRVEALREVHAALRAAGLAAPGAERLVDVTSCPGADTCQLGITSSRGMARHLTAALAAGPFGELDGMRVKISGCPNSCGQQQLASIGLFGGAKKFGERLVPTYQLMLAGSERAFGQAALKIPAANVPGLVQHLSALYAAERRDGEGFDGFARRYGLDRLKDELKHFAELPPYEQAPEKYGEIAGPQEEVGGTRTENFTIKVGKGECAA